MTRTLATRCLAVLLLAVSGIQPAPAAVKASDVVRQAVDGFIRPAYGALAGHADKTAAGIEKLCAAPDRKGLDAVRRDFAGLVEAWSAVELIRFGPIAEENRLERMLYWPDRKGLGLKQVQAALSSGDATAADPKAIETKGQALCRLFIHLVETRCAGYGLELTGPRDMAERGLHVSFAHPDAHAIVQALIARGVIGDFRDPDIARFGFSPLFLSHAEVWDAVEILREVLENRAFERPEFRARATVT